MATKNTKNTPRKRTTGRNKSSSQGSDTNTRQLNKILQGDKPEQLERGEVVQLVCGVLLLALAVFTLLSFVSHLLTGNIDQKLFEANYDGKAMNWTGYFGAWWSKFWITDNFGLGAFFIPIFLFAASFKLLETFRVRLWKWFINCAFLLCWTSVAAAFFFTSYFGSNPDISHISPGGYHGIHVVEVLEDVSGGVGTFIILLLTLLAYLCYLSAETIRFIQRLMHPKQLARDFSDNHPRITRFCLWLKQVLTPRKDNQRSDEEDDEKPADDNGPTATEEPNDAETTTADEIPLADIYVPGEEPDGQQTDSTGEGDSGSETADWIVQNYTDEDGQQANSFSSDGTAFTIERPTEEDVADENHEGALEPYDPKLDLENYHYPTLDLLKHYDIDPRTTIDMEEQTKNKDQIVKVLHDFQVNISSIKATVGPTITLYEITPAPGVRISKIRNLEDDIALSLAALGIRIIAPIPGKGTIGIEVPNAKPQIVSMESILNSKKFQETTMELPMALGKTITNEVFIADLAKMPHLLVAGATGQGKSVGLNAIITSLLYKKHPAELKFVMVDPKKVEFPIYSPIVNHFLAHIEDENDEPIITDVDKVVNTLKSLCIEMDTRYDLLKKAHARNIKEYNEKFKNRQLNPENGHKFMPYIVVIIDEFGDLIMTAGKEIELPIARIAQLARAVGIHMIIATQRPTTNIITGTIKANFPARMAFKVSAMVDSRTILDRPGANQLVGKGDMLFLAGSEPVRLQCAFVDTPEVEAIASYIAKQQSYLGPFELPRPPMDDAGGNVNDADLQHLDPLFAEAAQLIVSSQQGSTSMIQRKFAIGYNRAGRLMDQLEKAGVVGPTQGAKPRDVLIQDPNALDMLLNNLG
ncbi:MAG: DNA translocase FtsK [Bacteroidaceae bacterium]|nr:DNA translocase FtsK [Bacteroidaceae bacterium]